MNKLTQTEIYTEDARGKRYVGASKHFRYNDLLERATYKPTSYEEFIQNSTYSGITFSGGEPFLQSEALAELAIKIKRAEHELDIICYTGFTYEEIQNIINEGCFSI